MVYSRDLFDFSLRKGTLFADRGWHERACSPCVGSKASFSVEWRGRDRHCHRWAGVGHRTIDRFQLLYFLKFPKSNTVEWIARLDVYTRKKLSLHVGIQVHRALHSCAVCCLRRPQWGQNWLICGACVEHVLSRSLLDQCSSRDRLILQWKRHRC